MCGVLIFASANLSTGQEGPQVCQTLLGPSISDSLKNSRPSLWPSLRGPDDQGLRGCCLRPLSHRAAGTGWRRSVVHGLLWALSSRRTRTPPDCVPTGHSSGAGGHRPQHSEASCPALAPPPVCLSLRVQAGVRRALPPAPARGETLPRAIAHPQLGARGIGSTLKLQVLETLTPRVPGTTPGKGTGTQEHAGSWRDTDEEARVPGLS